MPVPQYLQSLQQPEPPTPPPAGDPDPLGLGAAAAAGAGGLGGSPEHWEGCDWTNPLDDSADFRGQHLPRSPGNQVQSPVRRGPAGSLLLSQCQSPVQPRLLPFHEEGEGKGLCGPRPGLPNALSPSRGVLSFIAAGVESGCLERQLRASRLPVESQPAGSGGKGFEVSHLGLSASPFSSVTKSSGSTAPVGRSAAPADGARGMQYIHIPEHALRDFRTFARNATQQACNDYAIKNPYAQALRRHREELEQNKVVPVAATDPTLEQRLATEREALCQLQDSPSPRHGGAQGLWCRPDDGRGRRCTAPEGACCAEESSPPAKLKSSEAALVYPLPIPDDFGSPSAGHCPLSARSFSSTTCSRHSNSNSEELKQGGETISGC